MVGLMFNGAVRMGAVVVVAPTNLVEVVLLRDAEFASSDGAVEDDDGEEEARKLSFPRQRAHWI